LNECVPSFSCIRSRCLRGAVCAYHVIDILQHPHRASCHRGCTPSFDRTPRAIDDLKGIAMRDLFKGGEMGVVRHCGKASEENDEDVIRVSLSMYGGALARKEHPVAALTEGEVVRDLGEVGVGVEALDYGLYLLNVVKTQVLGIRLNI